MRLCEFCTLKRHWKGRFGLHWPLVNRPGKLARELGRRELEQKRLEDAGRLALEDPGHRTQGELDAARAREAARADEALKREDDLRSARDAARAQAAAAEAAAAARRADVRARS